jgi:hypothetical protein
MSTRTPLDALAPTAFLFLAACWADPPPPPPPPPLEVVAAPASAVEVEMLDMPPTWGKRCNGASDCPPGPERPGRCLCGMPLPEGGAETTGFCWAGKIRPGPWWCTVEDGHAFLHGVIIPPQ